MIIQWRTNEAVFHSGDEEHHPYWWQSADRLGEDGTILEVALGSGPTREEARASLEAFVKARTDVLNMNPLDRMRVFVEKTLVKGEHPSEREKGEILAIMCQVLVNHVVSYHPYPDERFTA